MFVQYPVCSASFARTSRGIGGFRTPIRLKRRCDRGADKEKYSCISDVLKNPLLPTLH